MKHFYEAALIVSVLPLYKEQGESYELTLFNSL